MRIKKISNKAAEKGRRDRLKSAVEELARTVSQPCCDSSPAGSQTEISPYAEKGTCESQASCKASAIEFSVHYITCLKGQVENLQHQLQKYEAGQMTGENKTGADVMVQQRVPNDNA
jgi:hypothetical protein